ncbi:MAG: DUF6812 domain-containing protein [Gemmatimonadales bacterium]
MADPTPVLRQMPAEILCPLGWIQGTLHLPAHQSLDEYLALSGPSIKLTRARIPRESEPQQFLALRRDSISLVVPVWGGPVVASVAYGPTKRREIACLLPDRILRGSVEMPAALRLSDFLRLEGPFLAVRDGLVTPYGATIESPEAKTLELVLVNRDHIVGVSEPGR